MGTQNFKNLGAISKFWAPEGRHEASSLLGTHKYWGLGTKFSRRGDLAPLIFEPLIMKNMIMMFNSLNSV
jgi:hypothetical protein